MTVRIDVSFTVMMNWLPSAGNIVRKAMAERVRLIKDQAVDTRNIGTARNLWDSRNHAADFCIIYDAGFEQGSHNTS